MNCDDLDRQQIAKLRKKIGPMAKYLTSLRARMREREFPENDPLLQRVAQAAATLEELSISLYQLKDDSREHRPRRWFENATVARVLASDFYIIRARPRMA